MSHVFLLLVFAAVPGRAKLESRPAWLVDRVPLSPDRASEALEGRSDSNWVVRNVVDGRWGTPPYYPDQQWMARHIGEPGHDIWCRLDFGVPREVCLVRLQNSHLGSFVHLKDLELEFEGGSRLPITLAHNRLPQSFTFPTVRSSFLTIHLRSHYGDGWGIDSDSGGLAEVEVYGLMRGRAERTDTPSFTAARSGHVTTWLVAQGETDEASAPRWAVENEVVSRPQGRFWELVVSRGHEVPLPAGQPGLAECSLRAERPVKCRLELENAELRRVNGEPSSGSTLRLGPERWTDLLLRVTESPFSCRLMTDSGPAVGVRAGAGWYRDAEARQRRWLEDLAVLRPARAFVRPGEPITVTGIPDDAGYPCFPVDRTQVQAGLLAADERSAGRLLRGAPRGRYEVVAKLLPFGIERSSPVNVTPWATEGAPVPPGFTDLDGDGDPDVLRKVIRGFDCLIIDDDDDMTTADTDRDVDGDAILVDKDHDGIYDGNDDFYYKALDLDGDRDPDIEYYNANQIVKTFLDLDDDNVLTGSLDWNGFNYGNEMAHTGSTNYAQDVHGNGYFHNTRIGYPDLRHAWETPIAWYDFTGDGYTDLVMRVTEIGEWSARAEEFEVAFNIDADSGPGNECDLDFQLTCLAPSPDVGPDFSDWQMDFRGLRGLPEADLLFTRNLRLRTETRRIVFPYLSGYGRGLRYPDWQSCFLIWDEDDDDPRWEEMFGLNESAWNGYADHLGDRVEEDLDYSGGGRLYRAAFDGRWHLYGADRGEWLVDYYALYHGCVDRTAPEDLPPPPRDLRYCRVRYEDTNGNGFIDRLLYDDDGRPDTWEREVNLLEYGSDECPLISLAPEEPLSRRREDAWDGRAVKVTNEAWERLHRQYVRETEDNWRQALDLHDAAKKLGLTTSEAERECTARADIPIPERAAVPEYLVGPGYASLLRAETPAVQYNNAYRLRGKVFADVLRNLPEAARGECRRLYYTGQVTELTRRLPELAKGTAPGAPGPQ